MARSIVELYETDRQTDLNDFPFGLIPSREEMLHALRQGKAIDVILIGSDLPTAVAAQLLTLNGIRVAVITPGPFDYVGGRSLGDLLSFAHSPPLSLVGDALRMVWRMSFLKRMAPHRIHEVSAMRADTKEGGSYFGESWGLSRSTERALRSVGALTIMDDGSMVAESLLAARRDGALVVSHCEPVFLETVGDSGIRVLGLRDLLTGEQFECQSGGVVVAHGLEVPPSRLRAVVRADDADKGASRMRLPAQPPAAQPDGLLHAEFSVSEKRSQGRIRSEVVLENVPVIEWERPFGSLHVCAAVSQGTPAKWKEIELVLRSKYGVPLHLRVDTTSPNRFGRNIDTRGAALRLPTQSPLSALGIAEKLTRMYLNAAGESSSEFVSTLSLSNPGALSDKRVGARTPYERFVKVASDAGLDSTALQRTYMRWGDRVRYLDDFEGGLELLTPDLLRGELALAVVADQVRYAYDLPISCARISPPTPESLAMLQQEIDRIAARYAALALHR